MLQVQAIKSLLAIMGILIVAGFAFLGYEVYQRATDPTHPRAFGRGKVEAAAKPAPAPAAISAPAGSRIGQMLVLGPRVVYHVTLPDGSEQIHVLDPRDGTVQVPVSIPAAGAAAGAATP